MRDLTEHDPSFSAASTILLVECEKYRKLLIANNTVHSVSNFSLLEGADLTVLNPQIVICPLFKNRFDAIDVGKMILAYVPHAKLLIDAPSLPRPNMVLGEVLRACPKLKIDFFASSQWAIQGLVSA